MSFPQTHHQAGGTVGILLLALLGLSPRLEGQIPGRARFDHLAPADGLSHTTVWDIHQDSRGFLWFATQDGLNRFDGYEFRVYRHDPADPHSISNSEVMSLLEDRHGDLWLETRNQGLGRYVRERGNFEHYRHDPEDPKTLWSDKVASFFEDSAGELWISTNEGLNRFDRTDGVFVRVGEDPADRARSKLGNPFSSREDANGALWVGTDEGVARYELASDTLTVFRHDPLDPKSLSHDDVYSLYVDSKKQVWVGTIKGLNRFDPEGEGFVRYRHQADNPKSLSHDHMQDWFGLIENRAGDLFVLTYGGLDRYDPEHNEFISIWKSPEPDSWVTDILADSHGDLWIATSDNGMLRIRRGSEQPIFYYEDPSDSRSLSSNSPRALHEDRTGNVWIGTYNGIDRFDRRQEQFVTYSAHPKEGGLSSNAIWAIHEDRAGILWIGTYDQGLNRLDRTTGSVRHYGVIQPQRSGGLPSGVVMSLLEDSAGEFWIGTEAGLTRLDRSSGQFHTLRHDPEDPHSLGGEKVYILLEDRQARLWAGTSNGVDRLDRETGHFHHYRHDPEDPTSLEPGNVYSLVEDHSGVLWAGAMDSGISRFDQEQDRFVRFHPNFAPGEEAELPGVGALHEDQQGRLWAGTYGVGLLRLDVDRNWARRYQEADGLPSGSVNGILEDDSGHLWLSTNRGLSRFDPQSETFRNYSVADGLQGEVFSSGSFFRSPRGEMFFGGVAGLNAFFPDQIEHDLKPPALAITELRLFDEPAPLKRDDPDSPLKRPITETGELTFNHRQYVFSFEFAALHFANPESNRFAYRLEGFDRDWIEVDAGHRVIRYSNLAPDNYVFRVKASNHHGVWNEEGAAVRITVLPPPWKTWWAFTLYALALFTAIATYMRAQKRKLRRERALNKRLRQADQFKDEFLANTSHELRTPLYGMTGLAESMLDDAENLSATARENLGMIVNSGRRLSSLVDDILDFSKLSKQHLELHTRPVDLHTLCDLVLRLSRPLVGPKDLRLSNRIRTDLPAVEVDENRLQQIFHNLVGNAIKFTDEGEVEISAVADGDLVEVRVRDTGIGVPVDQQQHIFEVFQQADASSQRSYGGTGLGLAVTRELVALHGGSLWVESEPGGGSTFAFTLPVSSEPLPEISPERAEELRHLADAGPEPTLAEDAQAAQKPALPTESALQSVLNEARILIVDDESVIRQVLSNHLAHGGYRLAQAASGEEALQQIEDDGPFDLVLLDVMMPRMSGYETCQQLRLRHGPQQLPVVFLSAKNQINDLVEGLQAGGNDYLTKPIGKRELLARVETHLELLRMHRHVEDLVEERTAEIKIIRGMLPICAHCRKVRNDTGYWKELEEYVRQHTDTTFSHGMCPSCAHELYPELLASDDSQDESR